MISTSASWSFRACGGHLGQLHASGSPPGSCWATRAAGSSGRPRGAAATVLRRKPVVATTSGSFFATAGLDDARRRRRAPRNRSPRRRRPSSVAASGTPSGPMPASGPASSPRRGWPGASSAATSCKFGVGGGQGDQPLSHASGGAVNGNAIAVSMHSDECAARIGATCRRLTVQSDRLDDFVEIVGHGHGAIGEGGPADAAAAEHLVELLLVGRVVGDRGGRVLELMAGQDADDALVGPITPSATSSFAPATLAALAGSQPRPPAPTWALASRISWSVTSRTTPSQPLQRAEALRRGSPAG